MIDKKSIFKFQIFSAIFASFAGTLLHFTYDWSNNNFIVGAFSAVNESTWEHLKLLFFPVLITTIIGYFYMGKEQPNLLCAKLAAIISGILFIIIFFYTYRGVIGTNIDFLNILSFFIAVILGECVTYKRLFSEKSCNKILAVTILALFFICFVIFTYITPRIGLFKDPVTNEYGIHENVLQ